MMLINDATRAKIREAMERARAHPKSLAEVMRAAGRIDQSTTTVELAERDERAGTLGEPVQIPGGYTAAISFEFQPGGLCAHLSVSSPKRGKVPHPAAIELIGREFGFSFDGRTSRVWFEEFQPGWHAVNIVELVEPTNCKGNGSHAAH